MIFTSEKNLDCMNKMLLQKS